MNAPFGHDHDNVLKRSKRYFSLDSAFYIVKRGNYYYSHYLFIGIPGLEAPKDAEIYTRSRVGGRWIKK